MSFKILVVDDSESDRFIIKNALNEHNVLTAGSGSEALRILEENDEVDLLILDLNMPDMDGLQVLRTLKEDKRFQNLRIIILIDNNKLDDEIEGLKLGAIDYIRKPIHMVSLKARIDIHTALLRTENEERLRSDENAARQQDEQITFNTIFEQIPIGIAISYSCEPDHSDGGTVRINSAFEKITGRTKEELISLGWAKITHPDDLEEDIRNFRKLLAGEIKGYSMDKRYIKPDGSIVWVNIIVAPFTLSTSQKFSHICLIHDITGRKAIEEALGECERSKTVFLSHLPGLAYRCNYDNEWTMQYVSDGCFNLTGYSPESLLYNRDLSFNDIIAPEYREVLRKEWERVLAARQPFKYEYEIITATGERKWVLEMGQGIYNDDGEVEALEGIVLDISEQKEIENTLKYNNEHDKWTGLYNREYLVSLLEKDLKLNKDSKKALIGINLSMVHLLTANYGFQYSQNLIKKAAEALSQHCTDKCILFKPHESRFIFYLYDYKDKNELIAFSKVIVDTLEPIFVTERIGGSIGILEIKQNQNEVDVDILLRKLLIASERSVSSFGKDFEIYFYDEELEALINRERDIVEALTAIAASEKNADELYLQYQPIIDLRKCSIFGFEALARIRSEKLGIVSPLEFIPIAEKTKLIHPIGEKVIIKAFRFLNKLRKYGYDDVRILINISIIQLLKPNFTSRLFELIEEMQVNPKNIGIEITESVFAFDFDSINKIIEKLRETGLLIAIDDFGKGYSSLYRETRLKADYMKIDKYFVDRLLDINPNNAITGDIISISHKLGHSAIAEGVEHRAQLQYLKEHNCDKIQGFLISKPLDEEDAIEFIKSNKSAYLCS